MSVRRARLFAAGLTVALAAAGCTRGQVAPRPPLSAEQTAISAWRWQFQTSDRVLTAELGRVRQLVVNCSAGQGQSAALAPSAGLAVRDGLRVMPVQELSGRIPEDPGRDERSQADRLLLAAIQQVSMADWQVRRAASGAVDACEKGRSAVEDADRSLSSARVAAEAVGRAAQLPSP